MANQTFEATVAAWVDKVNGAAEAILKESAQELSSQGDDLLVEMIYAQPQSPSGYRRTGFLRASLMASTSQMPAINPNAKPAKDGAYTFDAGDITAVLAGADIGKPIYMGYVAAYSLPVHFGANGRPGRPWVSLAAQRWVSIVDAKSAELKSRLGL